jgi:hypothetical protein
MYNHKKLKKQDYIDIGKMKYVDQMELFKNRALATYKTKDLQENPLKVKKSDKIFQKTYETRLKGYNTIQFEKDIKEEALRRSYRNKR